MNFDRLKPLLDAVNDAEDCKQVYITTKTLIIAVHNKIRAKNVGERKDAFPNRLLYIQSKSNASTV